MIAAGGRIESEYKNMLLVDAMVGEFVARSAAVTRIQLMVCVWFFVKVLRGRDVLMS